MTITELQCPHCARRVHVHHLDWTALICMNCGRDIPKADWRVIGQAAEVKTSHPHIRRVIQTA